MRNFDKYKTAQEREQAFYDFCENKVKGYCGKCTAYGKGEGGRLSCVLIWLDLEAEEKPLPCPFCGGETIVRMNWNSTNQVVCNSQGCLYCSKCETTESDSIAAHNRVAKAVMESDGTSE